MIDSAIVLLTVNAYHALTACTRRYGGTQTFTCAGTGDVESWEPHFGYSGFRYAHVTNWPGELNYDSLTAHFVCVPCTLLTPVAVFVRNMQLHQLSET